MSVRGGARTPDHMIKSHALYQLSYPDMYMMDTTYPYTIFVLVCACIAAAGLLADKYRLTQLIGDLYKDNDDV